MSECARTGVESTGNLQHPDLTEASGLALGTGSGDDDGDDGVTVWAVNDSGNAAGLYAVGSDGTELGFFPLVDGAGAAVENRDVEDLAIHDGVLHVADIGDNNAVRETVTIHLVPEPTVTGVAAGDATVARTLTITYQTGPVDAEAFLVDPLTGQLVILDKDLSTTETTIFTVDPPFSDQPMEAVVAGTFDLAEQESVHRELVAAALIFPAAVTAADITPDGTLIAVRTYGTVWLFPRSAGQSVAEALTGTPCESGGAREGQGESLAFLGDRTTDASGVTEVRFLTVSEGQFRPVNITTVELG